MSQEPASTSGASPDVSPANAAKTLGWMELNCDKTLTQLVRTSTQEWLQAAQSAATARKPIERLGGEVARCTTYVKFIPNQGFPQHTHTGGEEFIVVDGVWSDDYGDFPKYSYLRNYIGSKHKPHMGPEGVQILVKLFQMSETHPEPETTAVNGAPDSDNWETDASGVKTKLLFESPLEKVTAVMLPAAFEGAIPVPAKGKEVAVIDGSFESALGTHDKMSWCRLVRGSETVTTAELPGVKSSEGCYLYVKEGHLESDEAGRPEKLRKLNDIEVKEIKAGL